MERERKSVWVSEGRKSSEYREQGKNELRQKSGGLDRVWKNRKKEDKENSEEIKRAKTIERREREKKKESKSESEIM